MAAWLLLVIGIAVLGVLAIAGFVVTTVRRKPAPPASPASPASPSTLTPVPGTPVGVPTAEPEAEAPAEEPAVVEAPELEKPEKVGTRLQRLRARLAGSGTLGKGLLGLLSRDQLDEDTWEAIEDLLIGADLGVTPTQELVERLRTRLRARAERRPRARSSARS